MQEDFRKKTDQVLDYLDSGLVKHIKYNSPLSKSGLGHYGHTFDEAERVLAAALDHIDAMFVRNEPALHGSLHVLNGASCDYVQTDRFLRKEFKQDPKSELWTFNELNGMAIDREAWYKQGETYWLNNASPLYVSFVSDPRKDSPFIITVSIASGFAIKDSTRSKDSIILYIDIDKYGVRHSEFAGWRENTYQLGQSGNWNGESIASWVKALLMSFFESDLFQGAI
jgi:hypothetical protein